MQNDSILSWEWHWASPNLIKFNLAESFNTCPLVVEKTASSFKGPRTDGRTDGRDERREQRGKRRGERATNRPTNQPTNPTDQPTCTCAHVLQRKPMRPIKLEQETYLTSCIHWWTPTIYNATKPHNRPRAPQARFDRGSRAPLKSSWNKTEAQKEFKI